MNTPRLVVGVDEAGRGPWAGPLVAACVTLRRGQEIENVRDSKQMSSRRRKDAVKLIQIHSTGIGVGWSPPREIDEVGLQVATARAMKRAYAQLGDVEAEIVVDGNINYLKDEAGSRALVRADSLIQAVSAASIIAKYYRDCYMERMEQDYPGYEFASHKGYGTRTHREMLVKYGISPLHRRSFKPIQLLTAEDELC